MYIAFFLLMAANLLAQETYVIDSVCVGAERTYRRDGEKLYTYYWDIVDRLAGDTMHNIPGVDFTEVDGIDTTWGNEITHLWDKVGDFDIVVMVTTEHGCDTVEQGMVRVFPLPEAIAGDDRVICNVDDIILSEDTAYNYSILEWTSLSDGTFSDPYSLHPTYYLGPTDSVAGSVTLVLRADGLADNGTCEPDFDTVTFTFSRPEVELTKIDPLCYNDSNASITANVTVGQPPFDYVWEGPPGFESVNSATVNGLWAGTYNVTVTDANNCTVSDSIKIVDPILLEEQIDDVGIVSCFGYSDAYILSSAWGGTGELSYNWQGTLGSTFDTDDIYDIPADTYILTVTDSNRCVVRDTVLIAQPDSLLAYITVDDSILCVGEQVILIGNSVGGTGSITSTWSGYGANFLDRKDKANVIFKNSGPGIFDLVYTIEDDEGCTASDEIQIIVYPPDFVYDSMEICAGADPFIWNDKTITSDMDRVYRDTLINQYGCDSVITLDVTVLFPEPKDTTIYICENQEPFVLYTDTIVPGVPGMDSLYLDTMYYSTSGCDSLHIKLEVFTLPITDTLLDTTLCVGAPEFAWNNRWIMTEQDSIYLDTLVNSFGCDSLLTYDVKVTPPDTFKVDSIICQDEPEFVWNGITIQTVFDSIYEARLTNQYLCDSLVYLNMHIVPSTDTIIDTMLCYGNPPYAWNNLTIFAENDSTYLDTLVNAAGCDSLLTYNVEIIIPDTVYVYDTFCRGEVVADWNEIPIQTLTDEIYEAQLTNTMNCDSIVYLGVTILQGITTHDTIEACEEYTWLAGNGQTYYASGTYLHTVGGSICADSLWLHLTISPPIDITADPVDVLCYGDSTGTIDITVSGGLSPFTFKWNTGETTEDLANLPAGIYSVLVTDIIGCSDSIEVEITQPDSVSIILEAITHVSDAGLSDGSIEVSVGGGTPGYTYEWTNEAGVVVGINEDLYNQPAGTYTLHVLDASDCPAEFTATIIEPVPPERYMVCAGTTDLTCYEDLANYPIATTLSEFLALDTSLEVYSICGIDTATFTYRDSVITASSYCYEEIRIYSVTDSCGNIVGTCYHQVIVDDKVPPTMSCPPDITVTDGIVPDPYADTTAFLTAGGTFDDNCAVVSFRHVRDVSDGGSDPEIITRTYEVTDYCGNVDRCAQIIEVYITVEFVIECDGLPSETFECKGDLPKYTLSTFRGDGGYANSYPLDIVSFTYKDQSNGQTCPETVTRTFTITNEVGDEESCTKVYVIDDNTPPTLILPDKEAYCSITASEWRLPYEDYVDVLRYRNSHGNDAFDNCGNSNIRLVTFMSQTKRGTCPTVYERVYRIYDRCNNWSETTELIYVYDTIAPVITYFEPIIESECDLPPEYTDARPFATDECAVPQITLLEEFAGGVTEPDVFYRRYRITDGCNDVDTLQKIIINTIYTPDFEPLGPLCQFTEAPELPDTSLDGFTGYWFPDTLSTDESGLFTLTFIPDSGQCASPVTMEIEVRPAIEVYELLHVDQDYNPAPVGEIQIGVYEGTTPFDYLWSNSDTTDYIDSLAAGTYTVYVNDAIGCIDTLTVEITSLEPELACIPDTAIECPDPSQYPKADDISKFMAYGGFYNPLFILDGFESFDQFVDRDSCLSIDRFYVIKDIYGRIDTCVQHVDFYDNVPPVIIAPDGDTSECSSIVIPRIDNYDDFIALVGVENAPYDPNCQIDPTTFTVRDTAIILAPGRSQVIYYFSIADFCGNVGRDTSYYLGIDDQAPEVFCADITVYLDEKGEYQMTIRDSVAIVDSVYDNCTAPEDLEVYLQWRDVTCEDVESGIQVQIMVVDEAGLSDSCTATITVADTLPPTALCKPDTIYLDENGLASITEDMIDNGSFDNCTDVTLELDRYNFDCDNLGPNTVTLTVTDGYGLQDSCSTTVTVLDTIAPRITCITRDTVQLSEEDGTYTLTYAMVTTSEWENCTIVDTLLSRYVLDCDDIENSPVTITAIAIDQSGNEGYCTAEFVVFGNLPPVALPDYDTTVMDVPVTVNVVENDYDVGLKTDIKNETLELVTAPANGSVQIDKVSGSVTYTPNPGFVGDDVFMYTICDDAIPCKEECAQALVFITVVPANEPPDAVDDYFEVPCISLTGSVTLNDSDPDGDAIVVNSVPLVQPVNGILVLYDDGHFEYEPFVDFTEGIDSFQYEIWDIPRFGETLYDTAWVYITRVPDNDCDGVADAIDIDDDNDGIRDNIENGGFWPEDPDAVLVDSDQDGIPDYLDIDSDNDGIVDNIEGQWEPKENWNEPVGWRDENNNGWDAHYDYDEGAGGIPFDIDLADTDGDGIPDYLDSDSDNDNVPDYIEGNDDNADGIADVTRIYSDIDRDGLDDAYDWVDGWGIPDLIDNETGSTAPLQDFDGDNIRDWRDINDEDDEYLTRDEDINGDGDYSNDDLDLDGHPEYLDTELECELFIPEGFSPNDDGVHDFFQILCIYPRYPDAKLMIFNRNGNLLWEKEKYGNYDYWGWNDAWWWGTSDNKLTIGRSGGLPAGNYIYVLLLNDGLGGVRNGTVMLAY